MNILVSTGSNSNEYKKILLEEINAQSLDCKLVEDISRRGEVNAIIYSDDCEISDFSIFPENTIIFSTFAGVEKTLLNKTIVQPLVRLIDVEMTECMAEWCTAHVLRYHLDLDNYIKPTEKVWTIPNKERLLADQVNIGILGLGTLGSATARKLKKLDFNVAGWSATKKETRGSKIISGTRGFKSDPLHIRLPDIIITTHGANKNYH